MATAIATMDSPSGCRRDVRPPVDSFNPSMWGDIFSTFSMDDQVQEMHAGAIESLKKEVKNMLIAAKSDKLIILIDNLERLGLAYHFEAELEEKLEEIYNFHENLGDNDEDYDLSTVALGFRLLRQHQYHVSCSMFDKFMDKDNKFKEMLSNDVEGLLNLYEAAHVLIHGEDILEKALAFTVHHLTHMLPELESPLKDKVNRALEQALHKGIPIMQARYYISIYERDDSRNELLLKLAKLNFNFLQNLYKKDLYELSRWWDKFDLKSKLPYLRDRLVECYLWAVSFHFEPQYSGVRLEVTKQVQLAGAINDTYDNYATLEEAQLFTEILERWDMDEIARLPDYMKTVYQFIMDTYEDYERDAAEKEKSFAVPYFKQAVKQLGKAYNQKLQWVMEGHIPSFEDYLANSEITSCVYLLLIASVPSMKSATKETIDWLLSEPKIVISTTQMGRLLDDLASHERESKGGKMLTVVDCCMKYYGLSRQETLSKLVKLTEDGWKDLNVEWIAKPPVPKDMVEQCLNYTRATEVIYKNGVDGYVNPEKFLAPQIIALLKDPLVL